MQSYSPAKILEKLAELFYSITTQENASDGSVPIRYYQFIKNSCISLLTLILILTIFLFTGFTKKLAFIILL